jgi:hypothetical protein
LRRSFRTRLGPTEALKALKKITYRMEANETLNSHSTPISFGLAVASATPFFKQDVIVMVLLLTA